MKKFVIISVSIVAILAIAVAVIVRIVQGPGIEQGETDLRFREIAFPHSHSGNLDKSLPFMGMSAIDVDGDAVDEIFVGGGHDQADGIFRYTEAGFVPYPGGDRFHKDSTDATFGAASIDTNGDGLDDLFVARESGVYYHVNEGDDGFATQLIEFELEDNTTPLSVALGDVNRDGWVDLYISGYIKLDHAVGETNFDEIYGGFSHLLLNQGDNTWVDVTREAGLYRQHNTFLAMFIDLDNDQWTDLVVAQDTGVLEIWRNRGDLTFERAATPTDYSYPMGIGAGDIDNDGLVDLYISNVGHTLPAALLRGNLAEDLPFNMDYMLLRNRGDFTFEDISTASNAGAYGFGWGVVIADFNNDSRMDLYFAQNYARFPGVDFLQLYPGRLLQQYPGGHFQAVEGVAGIANQNFGITQVVSDFNQDGWPDMVLGNLTGPVRAFLNSGGDRHSLTVRLPGDATWLNARVTVTTAEKHKLTRQLFASEGLCSDQTRALFFGLNESSKPVQVEVQPIGGEVLSYPDVPVDSVLQVKP